MKLCTTAALLAVVVSVGTLAVFKQPLTASHRAWLFGRAAPSATCLLKVKELLAQGEMKLRCRSRRLPPTPSILHSVSHFSRQHLTPGTHV